MSEIDPTKLSQQIANKNRPRHPRWQPFALFGALGAIAALIANLPWQLVVFAAFFGAGVWPCLYVIRKGTFFDIGIFIGLYLLVAGALLELVAMTL